MTVTLTEHVGEIYISFEGETAAEVVELYRGYRDVEREAVTPVKPDDEWIEWGGGICPIAPESARVDIKFRSGSIVRDADPHKFIWRKGDGLGAIVAYRVVSP